MPKYRVISGKVFKRYPKEGLVCHKAGTPTAIGVFDVDFYEKNRDKLEPLAPEVDAPVEDLGPELPFPQPIHPKPIPTKVVEDNPKEESPVVEDASVYMVKPRGGGWYDVVDANTGKRISNNPMHKPEAERFIEAKQAKDGKSNDGDNR